MYVWKLWREAWTRLAACAFIGIVCAVSIARIVGSLSVGAPVSADRFWLQVPQMTLPAVVLASLLAAIAVAETTIGNEFATGTAEFLLTRGRPRGYFVWAGWATGMTLLVLMTLLIVVCQVAALASVTGTFTSWRPFAACGLVLPSLAVVYGVGYLLSVVARSGRNGAGLTIAVVLLYVIGSRVLLSRWNIAPPDWWFDSLLEWMRQRSAPFPFAPVIGWTLVALLFPVLAQWRLEYMDI